MSADEDRILSITETMSVGRQVDVGGPTGSKVRFGMLTADILARTDITPAAKVVFAVLRMESFGTGGVTISHGAISKKSGISRSQVLAIIKDLESIMLIAKVGELDKQIQPYRIICECPEGQPALPQSPTTLRAHPRRRVDLTDCVLCKTPCVPSRRTGWCASCSKDARNRNITNELIRKQVEAALALREGQA